MNNNNQRLAYSVLGICMIILFGIILRAEFMEISPPDQITVNHPVNAPSQLMLSDFQDYHPVIDLQQYRGRVVLVHFFASWCSHCRNEHPLMMEIAKMPNLTIIGVSYKDSAANLIEWFKDVGNPYAAVGLDQASQAADRWHVDGTPTSFLLNKEGKIIFQHNGEFTAQIILKQLKPLVEQAAQ